MDKKRLLEQFFNESKTIIANGHIWKPENKIVNGEPWNNPDSRKCINCGACIECWIHDEDAEFCEEEELIIGGHDSKRVKETVKSVKNNWKIIKKRKFRDGKLEIRLGRRKEDELD